MNRAGHGRRQVKETDVEAAREREPHIIRIGDGVFAQVVDRSALLPAKLEPLLVGMRVVREITDVRIAGARRACMENEHALQPWRQGLYRGLELRLSLCFFCAAVEVRDVSLDILREGAVALTLADRAHRRDAVLGWYAGRRPAGREYH